MLDQPRQVCNIPSRELILLYWVSSVHVHPHAATHARLSGCSTPEMTRCNSSPSALSRHILNWHKCQWRMDQIWTQQTCMPSNAVMQQPVCVLRGYEHTLSVPSWLRSERGVIPASQRRVQSHSDCRLCKHNTPLRNEEQIDHKQI